MSVLTMVRHGQATPFEKETDRLSPLGEEQARHLAAFWLRNNLTFDEAYCGSLVRQRRTAEIIGDCFREAGAPWPELQVNPDLNEFDGAGILSILKAQLMEGNPEFCQLVEAADAERHGPERNRHFQRMMEPLIAAWLSGTVASPRVESWQAFHDRVHRGISGIIRRSAGNRRVAVFTSGGPIGATVQRVLEAPPRSGIEMNWRVRNCSLTEFIFTRNRMTLDLFNGIPHLQDPALHSYR